MHSRTPETPETPEAREAPPPPLPPLPGRDREHWLELVRLLHSDLDAIVEEFLAQVAKIPPYDRGSVPIEQVRRDAVASFDHLCRLLAGLPAHPAVDGVARDIGRDRARRHVPLEQLLRAVRLDFQVVWSVLRRLTGPADLPLLVAHVEHLWGIVEDYTTQVQVSYMAEAALMARESGFERTALVARLLDGAGSDPDDVDRAAVALGLDPDARVLVACAPLAAQAPLIRAFERALAAGRVAHWQERARYGLLLLEWRGEDERAVEAVLGDTRCAVGPLAAGLADVPRSARVAQRIADVLDPGDDGPRQLTHVLDRVVAAGLGDLRDEVAAAVLGGLDAAGGRERVRLVETAEAYLRAGSVQETARALYCHRNTVLNRMSRFAELTGQDLTVPRSAAAVYLALGARQAPAATTPLASPGGAV